MTADEFDPRCPKCGLPWILHPKDDAGEHFCRQCEVPGGIQLGAWM